MPKLRPGINLTKLGLSMEEGFVASRVDGHTAISGIAHLIGKSKAETEKILARLKKVGVIEMTGGVAIDPDGKPKAAFSKPTPKPTGEKGEAFDYGNFVFPPPLMLEEVDLRIEERKRIIFFFENLETWTHYELLEVGRRDDAKSVKRAYFLRSKEWHPDRFRRGNLGSFRKMIDAIYMRVKLAHDVLSDDEQRKEYDETCIFAPDEEEIAEMLESQRKIEREKRREQEAIERRKRRNPMFARMEQARASYTEALEKEKKGELRAALRAAQAAVLMDARAEYTELVERLKLASGEARIKPHIKYGQELEAQHRYAEAIEAFREVLRLKPEHPVAHLRLAYNLMMGGYEAQEANVHATKAATLLPDDPEAHFILGMCYEKGGLEKAAVRAYARVAELDPENVEAKKRLKKLKWGF